jgi:hypothetical protein
MRPLETEQHRRGLDAIGGERRRGGSGHVGGDDRDIALAAVLQTAMHAREAKARNAYRHAGHRDLHACAPSAGSAQEKGGCANTKIIESTVNSRQWRVAGKPREGGRIGNASLVERGLLRA